MLRTIRCEISDTSVLLNGILGSHLLVKSKSQIASPDSNIRIAQRSGISPEYAEMVKRLNQPTDQHARITSLKIMAAALLRRIESLETLAANEVTLVTEVRLFEAEIIRQTLIETGGVQRQAARLLGLKISTLHSKIKRYEAEFGMRSPLPKRDG